MQELYEKWQEGDTQWVLTNEHLNNRNIWLSYFFVRKIARLHIRIYCQFLTFNERFN